LRRDEDVAQPRVDAVAEDEIDDAVRPAEVDRRLGAFAGQRREPFARAARQNNHENVITKHGLLHRKHITGCNGKPLL
jgi:hypothetical protein